MNSKAIEGIVLTICFLTSSISAQAKEVPFLDQVNRTVQLFLIKQNFKKSAIARHCVNKTDTIKTFTKCNMILNHTSLVLIVLVV